MPNEPVRNQVEALKFYNETRPHLINTFSMAYLPKTKLNKFLSKEKQEEVNKGKICAAMVIKNNHNFASLFAILPLIPQRVMNFVIKHKLYEKISFPFWLRLLFKDIMRLKIKRYSDVFFPLQLILVNIKDNIFIKWRIR
jgi:hypothetical protein